MKKIHRLRKNTEFKKVYVKGKNYWNRNFTLYIKKNELNYTRFGIVVTKKLGKAVVRNKIKRRLREINKNLLPYVSEGYDIVLIPKKNTLDLNYEELQKSVEHLYSLAGILKR
ncbi:MAG: ribonuclease P protein component [Tissierellales bacterium]|nr:ribonuclease P protein component [Tissierellales bacterium]